MVFPIAAILVLAALVLRPAAVARLRARFWTKAVADRAFSIAAVIAALVVLMHGDVWVAFCLFGLSLWMLGRSAGVVVRRPSVPRPSIMLARSASVELATDVATGRRSARMTAGSHRGAVLDQLGLDGCLTILAACRVSDPAGARLLEDYLDGRTPLWRTASDRDEDAGPRRSRLAGEMSEQQAYQLFGLASGAPREAIVRAHRTLMKKWHPDQGGSAELAARANEAKEVLLRRHG